MFGCQDEPDGQPAPLAKSLEDLRTPKSPEDLRTPKGPEDLRTPKSPEDLRTPKGPEDRHAKFSYQVRGPGLQYRSRDRRDP